MGQCLEVEKDSDVTLDLNDNSGSIETRPEGLGFRSIFVTGGNSGIGLALCKQLASEDRCYVYMGSRSLQRGQAALKSLPSAAQANIEVVQCDIADPASVAAAAETIKTKRRGSPPLYALVNNAGVGLAHGVSANEVNDVNLYGTKSMVDSFLRSLQPQGSRIVNVSSGAGPMWLAKQKPETQKLLTSGSMDWSAIDKFMSENRNQDAGHAYGLSKCLLCVYTEWLSRDRPQILSSSISPGFIDTAIVKGMGASKPPEEGTVSIRHCLFENLVDNGCFYGSDALRSPFYPLRNPGQAPFSGVYPWSP